VFLVENPETRDALGLRGKPRDRYSWKQMEPLGARLDSLARMSLLLEPRQRSRGERDLLRVADSWNRYFAVRHALDPVRILPSWSALRPLLDSLLRVPEKDLDADAQATLKWVHSVLASAREWSSSGLALYVHTDGKEIRWASPGDELLLQGPSDSLDAYWDNWRELRKAWLRNDEARQKRYATALRDYAFRIMEKQGARPQTLKVEYLYNRIDPFFRALLLYGCAAILAMVFLWSGRPALARVSYVILGLGWLLHVVGMVLRGYIVLRPPATNLYDTFVFSGACAVLLAVVAGRIRALRATVLLAALAGSALLMLARRYGMDGDTMPVLAAVLDSNFWLSIHVLTITLGYAAVLVGGLYAHMHLVLCRRKGESSNEELAAFRTLRLLMMLGLLFTCLGTLLGAIWADQSWGRFWGWDPKENGALLIILWVAFLFHALPCGWMHRRGFSLGCVFAIQTVLFAWFGVNLMGVGLHSYGFTEGTLQGLLAFAMLEVGFVAWILWPQQRRPRSAD